MAFITSHNANKLVVRNNFKEVNLFGEIYKYKIYLFSKHETNSLLAIQELFKDPQKYFNQIYNPIVTYDTKKYIFKEKKPGYHSFSDCKLLNADFTNFLLPLEIIERGDEEIEKFRNWFIENYNLLEDPAKFTMRLELAFKIKYNPKAINYINSGIEEHENLTIQEIENRIDDLLKAAGKYYYESQKNTTILKIFGKISGCAFTNTSLYKNYTGYSNEEVIDFLKEYHMKFKVPLKKWLIEYYRVKLNPDLQFAENILESLGFKKCGCCKKKELEEKQFNNFSLNRLKPVYQTSHFLRY